MNAESLEDKKLEYMSQHQLIATLVRYDTDQAVYTDLWTEWRNVSVERAYDVYTKYTWFTQSPIEFGKWYLAYQYRIVNTQANRMMNVNQLLLQYEVDLTDFLVKKFNLREDQTKYNIELIKLFNGEIQKQLDAFIKEERMRHELQVPVNTMMASPPLPYCMEVRKLTEDIPIDLGERDLWSLFNHVVLTPTIPYCTYQGFYKFREDVKIEHDWNVCPEFELKAYVRQDNQYQPFYVTSTYVRISSNFKAGGTEETPQLLLQTILQTFHLQKRQASHQKQIKAKYNLVAQPFRIPYFLYHLQRDPLLNKFVFVDESRVNYAKKKYLYISFYPDIRKPSSRVSFNLSVLQGLDAKRVRELEVCNNVSSPSYVHVNFIHCPNQRLMEQTISFLSRVLSTYQDQGMEIAIEDKWRRDGVEMIAPIPVKKGKDVAGQQRGLPSKPTEYKVTYDPTTNTFIVPDHLRHVSIVNKDDAYGTADWNTIATNLPQGLLFPKNKPSETKLYVCEYKDLSFIDLREFNGQLIPYCFKTNAAQNYKSSQFYKYDKAVQPSHRDTSTGYKKKTSQLLTNVGQRGSVMHWMSLWNVMYHPSLEYERVGITSIKHATDSILWLLESIKDGLILRDTEANQRRIHDKRIELAALLRSTPGDLYTTCQSKHIDAYLDQFEQGYIDPLIYGVFLGRVYQTHLFFFTKQGITSQEDEFYLIPPSYKYECTLIHESYPTFTLVCLHPGSDFNRPEFPLCELIVAKPREEKVVNKFEVVPMKVSHPSFMNWKKTAYDMYGIKERTLPLPKNLIQSMSIDDNGLVSWLHISSGSIALLEPMHSIDLRVTTQAVLWSNDAMDAFVQAHAFQRRKEDRYLQYDGVVVEKDGCAYFLPTLERPRSHELSTYDWYERTSRYLIEYTLYAFSHYVHDQRPVFATKEDVYHVISAFANITFVEQADVCQQPFTVSRRLAEPNAYFNPVTKKITIPSTTIKKKVIYYLLQEYNTQHVRLLAYRQEHYMRNYYVKISDLEAQPNTVLLQHESSFSFYVKHQRDSIQRGSAWVRVDAIQPYVLFKSIPELNGRRWIMQPVDSVAHAYAVYHTWTHAHVNTWRVEQPYRDAGPYHAVMWYDDMTYEVQRADVDANVPILALFGTRQGTILQLMLPFPSQTTQQRLVEEQKQDVDVSQHVAPHVAPTDPCTLALQSFFRSYDTSLLPPTKCSSTIALEPYRVRFLDRWWMRTEMMIPFSPVLPSPNVTPPLLALNEVLLKSKSTIDEFHQFQPDKEKFYGNVARRMDPFFSYKHEMASMVLPRKSMTNAWLKCWEMIYVFRLIPLKGHVNLFCNAELPGAFIFALNHFIKTKTNTTYDWVANSLYPSQSMILDDEFKLYERCPSHWLMSPQHNGDVTDPTMIDVIATRCQRRIDVYTSDIGIEIGTSYHDQEYKEAHLNLGQMLCALRTLKEGGSMVCKTFMFFYPLSMSILYLTSLCFTEFFIYKPETSRPRNSEVYVIGKGFVYNESVVVRLTKFLKRWRKEQWAEARMNEYLVPIPEDFYLNLVLSLNNIYRRQIEYIQRHVETAHALYGTQKRIEDTFFYKSEQERGRRWKQQFGNIVPLREQDSIFNNKPTGTAL